MIGAQTEDDEVLRGQDVGVFVVLVVVVVVAAGVGVLLNELTLFELD